MPCPKHWNSIVARLTPLLVTTIARKRLPWHREIDDTLARKICKDLGVVPVK